MHKTERLLLDNLLDGLDRLFDGDTTVVDIHDLVYATLIALADTKHAPVLCVAETKLMSIARSGNSRNQQREAALMVTHELRQYLALSLPFPESKT